MIDCLILFLVLIEQIECEIEQNRPKTVSEICNIGIIFRNFKNRENGSFLFV